MNRFAVASGTLPNKDNTNYTFEMPAGFTHANCVCIGLVYRNANGTTYHMTSNQAICLHAGRLSYTASDVTNGRPFSAIFYRYN